MNCLVDASAYTSAGRVFVFDDLCSITRNNRNIICFDFLPLEVLEDAKGLQPSEAMKIEEHDKLSQQETKG